jgi:hypothetical protein
VIKRAQRQEDDLNWFGEIVLDDDYPVYADYLYVADGKVIKSPLFGLVKDLKKRLGVKEVRNCDMFKRRLL